MYMKTRCFCVGSGATSVVQAANCLTNNTKVAIKRIELEQCGATIEELQVLTPPLPPHCNLTVFISSPLPSPLPAPLYLGSPNKTLWFP